MKIEACLNLVAGDGEGTVLDLRKCRDCQAKALDLLPISMITLPKTGGKFFMTDKQFWMKLDQLNSSSISSELKAAILFKKAATEGLSILVVGRKGEPKRREIGEDLSFFLCYTSRKHAQEDRDNGGMWSTYPVSKMYETILSDDTIGGIVLNSYSDQHICFLTSTMLKMEEEELERLSSYSDAKDLLKKGRALESEIKDRIANGEIVSEEVRDNIAEHSRLLNDLESLLSTSADREDAPRKSDV